MRDRGRLLAVVTLATVAAVLAGCSQHPQPPAGAGPAPSASSSGSGSPTPSATTAGAVAPLDVRSENARPGTRAWAVSRTRGTAPGLAAYADHVSVRPGDAVALRIDADGPVTVSALRTGWYGGLGARVVWTGRATAFRQRRAILVDGPVADAGGLTGTRTVVAPWRTTLTIPTVGWPEGAYLLRVDAGAATRLVPLTVRSASAAGRLLVLQSAMTWQAYNEWGGASLYGEKDDGSGARSLAVSFDRPYADAYGAGRFAYHDLPILRVAERLGLPLAYATDADLDRQPGILDGATGVVVGGHAEYWTARARNAVVAAVGRGTNLAVFGANTAYWRARLAGARPDGEPRLVVVTKDAARDPLAARDPGGTTARFRDPPVPRPEQQLTGMQYDCFPARGSWVVTDPGWFGYAGLRLRAGQDLGAFVLPESDRVVPGPATPPDLQVVAYDRFDCGPGRPTAHTGVWWSSAAGAGVFAAGTMGWACALAGSCSTVTDRRGTSRAVAAITANVLRAVAAPRAGAAHPPRPDVGRFDLPSRSTTGTS